jgi:hypothetical protein
MVLQLGYHGFMRAVLRIRRLLLERERRAATTVGEELEPLAYVAAPDEPPLDRFDAQALAVIRRPPRGRLNPWVLEQVARDYAVAEACIEDALWASKRTHP